MTKNRNVSLDLLRVIGIFSVLILHYLNADIGGILDNNNLILSNNIIAHFVESLCIVGVNSFVIVSGYFMIDRKSTNLRKVIDLFTIVIFYAIITYIIVLLANVEILNMVSLKTFLLSIINRWFVVIYIILYLLSPYINKLFKSLSKKEIFLLIMIMLIFFSIWPTFLNNVTVKDGGYGIINFIMLYLIGGYIKVYYDDYKSAYKSFIIYIIFTIITFIFSYFASRAWLYNTIFNIISSISLFLLFKSININNKFISNIANFSFGVYIIHGNPFIMKLIYCGIFLTPQFSASNLMILHMICTCLIIFVVCILIEIVRKYIFKYSFDLFFNKISFFNKKISLD